MAISLPLEDHRAALTGHCYRMLGSAAEADDAVQETMVRTWRHLDRFEGRASLRSGPSSCSSPGTGASRR